MKNIISKILGNEEYKAMLNGIAVSNRGTAQKWVALDEEIASSAKDAGVPKREIILSLGQSLIRAGKTRAESAEAFLSTFKAMVSQARKALGITRQAQQHAPVDARAKALEKVKELVRKYQFTPSEIF